ncbi:MAG: 1,4-dihydroxy-6-naphthoate synthase [Tidjanibacter sp.]|nr:1,4-dihydroxy-6-naphthoate synthase [Tidjanibacter sp.]
MRLSLNISPCPNDTFMFHAMLFGLVDTEGLEFDVSFYDIEELNARLLDGNVQISKSSYAVLPAICRGYALLDSGSALGRGNGPLVVAARDGVMLSDGSLRVAVPGEHTTANMLMDRLFPVITDKTPRLFSTIAESVAEGEFDAGVLIHEGRFTYQERGLKLVADLGEEWEQTTSLPLPLGAIVASRELSREVRQRVERVLRRSVEYAFVNPDASFDFVLDHAREMKPDVVRSHIELFVNRYSLSLGEDGLSAVKWLTGLNSEELFG